MESLECGESNNISLPEAVTNNGPTLLVGLGLQLTADTERLTARTWNMPDILWMRAASGNLENTTILLSGGYTGETKDQGSEAEQMFLRLEERMAYLKQTHLADLKEKITLWPIEVTESGIDLKYARLIAEDHWHVPVFIDNKASSLQQNFSTIPPYIYDYTDSLIALFAGPARPSAARAKATAQRLLPGARLEVFEGDEGTESERVKRALNEEGLFAALQETEIAERGITIATHLGLGEFLSHLTQKRIKN